MASAPPLPVAAADTSPQIHVGTLGRKDRTDMHQPGDVSQIEAELGVWPSLSRDKLDIQDQSLKASAGHFTNKQHPRGRPRLRTSGGGSVENMTQVPLHSDRNSAPYSLGAAPLTPTDNTRQTIGYPRLAQESTKPGAQGRLDHRGSFDSRVPGVIRLARVQAWTRMASYEACLQVCQATLLDPTSKAEAVRASRVFLLNRSELLRSSFQVHGLFFGPAGNGIGGTPPLEWDEGRSVAIDGCRGSRTVCIRVQATKLAQSRNAFWAKIRRTTSLLSEVEVVVYPKSRPYDRVCWSHNDQHTRDGAHGDNCSSKVLEVECAELDADSALIIELRGGGLPYPHRASIGIADLIEGQQECMSVEPTNGMITSAIREAWIQVADSAKVKVGKVLLGVWTRAAPGHAARSVANAGSLPSDDTVILTGTQLYQHTMQTALRCLECGPRKLEVSGHWHWLLESLADVHGIRSSTSVLSHLEWVLNNPIPSSACLSLLAERLQPLLHAQKQGQLLNLEVATLKRLMEGVDQLLGHAFESYRRLSDDVDGGVLENGSVALQEIPTALGPAVNLFCVVRDPLDPTDQSWLADCLKRGIQWRYTRLESEILPKDLPSHEGDSEFSERVYAAAGTLCLEVLNEMRVNMKLHDSGVFPSSIDIATHSGREYCTRLSSTLAAVLQEYQPLEPSKPVLQLVQSAGMFQAYLQQSGVFPDSASCSFSVQLLFVPYVSQWIAGSRRRVTDACHNLSGTHIPRKRLDGDCRSTAAKAALDKLETELQRYEAVVQLIPQTAAFLEDMCKAVLLEILVIADDLYGGEAVNQGMAHSKSAILAGSSRSGRAANRIGRMLGLKQPDAATDTSKSPISHDAGNEQQYSMSPEEALMLNSMRQLLVAIPRLEALLSGWAGEAVHHFNASDTLMEGVTRATTCPRFGDQLAQVLTEIRIAYSLVLKAVVDRMANYVLMAAPHSLEQAIGLAAQAAEEEQSVAHYLQPLVRCAATALDAAAPAVQDRLLVALTRGLWEKVANKLYLRIQELNVARKEEKSALGGAQIWRVHQNTYATLMCIDESFKNMLQTMAGHGGLKESDMNVPSSSSECSKLLLKSPKTALAESFVLY